MNTYLAALQMTLENAGFSFRKGPLDDRWRIYDYLGAVYPDCSFKTLSEAVQHLADALGLE